VLRLVELARNEPHRSRSRLGRLISLSWQRDILDLEQEHSAAEKQAQDLEIEIQKLWNEKTTMVDELQKRTR
jgi:hypothetical protein